MARGTQRWRGATGAIGLLAAAAFVVGACTATTEPRDDGPGSTPVGTAEPSTSADWPFVGFDAANSRYNPAPGGLGGTDVTDLGQVWSVDAPKGVSSTPTVVDGVVYVGDWTGNVRALEAATGAERWTTPIGTSIMSSITVADDAVYAADNRSLVRLDRATGAELWRATTSDHPIAISPASPVVVGDLVIQGTASGELMVPVDDYRFRGSVAAFDAATGAERWRTWFTPDDATGGAGVGVWSTPSVDEARGVLYVGSGNTYEPPAAPLSDSLVALRVDTGEVVWSRQFTTQDVWSTGNLGGADADVGVAPNLWSAGGRDLVGAGDKPGVYHALDRDTGEVVWEAKVAPGGLQGGVIGSSAHGDGVLYVGANVANGNGGLTGEATVAALDDGDGAIRWQVNVPGTIYAPVTAIPGVVLVATTRGTLHALDASDGSELWTFTAPDQSGSGPSVVDGTVYWGYGFALFGSGSGAGGVYAFRPAASASRPGDGTGSAGTMPSDLGAQVFLKSCSGCHGRTGQGGVGPSLVGIAGRLTPEQHEQVVRQGRGQMAGFEGVLSDEEIAAVIDHERNGL